MRLSLKGRTLLMSGNELPKVVDKTQANIDAAIATIKSCNLPSGTKDFVISCIKLAVWLPKALLEQKIRLANLRKLVFGRAKNNCSKPNKGGEKPSTEKSESEHEPPANDADITQNELSENDPPSVYNSPRPPGHGRLSHSAYINTIEHTLTITEFKAGDS